MNNHRYHRDGSQPHEDEIFVFGSNLSGIHGAGAARAAQMFYGAKRGNPRGLQGKSYAVPTVKERIAGPLSLQKIQTEVDEFLNFARNHPFHKFFVTRIGCGLAGHRDQDIAPMFKNAPDNCNLPDTWQELLEN